MRKAAEAGGVYCLQHRSTAPRRGGGGGPQLKARQPAGLAQGVQGRALWLMPLFHDSKRSGCCGEAGLETTLGISKRAYCGLATLSNCSSGGRDSHWPRPGMPKPSSCFPSSAGGPLSHLPYLPRPAWSGVWLLPHIKSLSKEDL